LCQQNNERSKLMLRYRIVKHNKTDSTRVILTEQILKRQPVLRSFINTSILKTGIYSVKIKSEQESLGIKLIIQT